MPAFTDPAPGRTKIRRPKKRQSASVLEKVVGTEVSCPTCGVVSKFGIRTFVKLLLQGLEEQGLEIVRTKETGGSIYKALRKLRREFRMKGFKFV